MTTPKQSWEDMFAGYEKLLDRYDGMDISKPTTFERLLQKIRTTREEAVAEYKASLNKKHE